MPVPAAYNARSGASKFLILAAAVCRIVNVNAHIIRERYPERPALLAALNAAEAVCALLPAAFDEQVTMDAAELPPFDTPDGTPIPGEIS